MAVHPLLLLSSMLLMRFLKTFACCALPVYCPTAQSARGAQDDRHDSDARRLDNPSGIRLPYELERYIMELALLDQPRFHSIALLLVARRTHAWLEPLFYHSAVLNTPTKAAIFASFLANPARSHLYHAHVKHLLLRTEDLYLHPSILSTCTNIRHLTILPSSSFYAVPPPATRTIASGRALVGSEKASGVIPSASSSPIPSGSSVLAPIPTLTSTPASVSVPGPTTISTPTANPNTFHGLHSLLKQYNHLFFPHLTHLRITLDRSFGLKKIDFGLRVLENVTHLEVWNTIVREWRAWEGMWSSGPAPTRVDDGPAVADADRAVQHAPLYLPRLTHLSVTGFGLSFVPHLLQNSERISCVVVERAPDAQTSDTRLVVMPPALGRGSGSSVGGPEWFEERKEFWNRVEEVLSERAVSVE